MKIRFTIAIAFLLLAGEMHAQQPKRDTVITQIITFESTDGGTAPEKYSPKKNSVGIGMVSWLQGYVPVYYERQLLDFLSIKIGVGLTFRSFTTDLGMLIWNDGKTSEYFVDDYIGFNNLSDLNDHYANYTFRKSSVGYYFSLAPKFYVQSDGMEGFTVYPMVEYKHFGSKARKARTDVPTDNFYYNSDVDVPRYPNTWQKEKMGCVDFTVNIGGLYQTRKQLAVEWRLGIGIRKSFSNRLDVGEVENINGSSYLLNIERKYDRVKPFICTDLIIGGVF